MRKMGGPHLVCGVTADGKAITYMSDSSGDVPNNLLSYYAAAEAPLLVSFVKWSDGDRTTYD